MSIRLFFYLYRTYLTMPSNSISFLKNDIYYQHITSNAWCLFECIFKCTYKCITVLWTLQCFHRSFISLLFWVSHISVRCHPKKNMCVRLSHYFQRPSGFKMRHLEGGDIWISSMAVYERSVTHFLFSPIMSMSLGRIMK